MVGWHLFHLGFICVYQVSESLPCSLCLCPNLRLPGDMRTSSSSHSSSHSVSFQNLLLLSLALPSLLASSGSALNYLDLLATGAIMISYLSHLFLQCLSFNWSLPSLITFPGRNVPSSSPHWVGRRSAAVGVPERETCSTQWVPGTQYQPAWHIWYLPFLTQPQFEAWSCLVLRDGSRYQIGYIFGNVLSWEGVVFNPKIYIADFGPL